MVEMVDLERQTRKRDASDLETPQNDIKSIILTIESKGIRNFDCNHWNEVAEPNKRKTKMNKKTET